MAVPNTLTIKDLSGTYTLNKTLSDSLQPMLLMQNIGWIIRQAVQYSSITVTLKQYTDDKGVVHLDQEQVSTGGIRNTEDRTLDGEWREKGNRIWGLVKSKSRFIKLSELEDEFLKEGWTQDCIDGEVIESINESVNDTWTAHQIYGFMVIDGEKKQIRKIVGKKGNQVERIRMVYDWKA